MNPGPMTEPTVFYVRSLLAKLAIFLPPSMSQTTDGEHIRSQSPDAALRLNCISKSSKRRSASSQRRGGVNGAAAHWLTLARSSGSESELSAVRFSTYSFAGVIHERTRRSRHASLQRTGHRRNRSPPILSYQASGFSAGLFSIHPMALLAQIASSEHRPGTNEANEIAVT